MCVSEVRKKNKLLVNAMGEKDRHELRPKEEGRNLGEMGKSKGTSTPTRRRHDRPIGLTVRRVIPRHFEEAMLRGGKKQQIAFPQILERKSK